MKQVHRETPPPSVATGYRRTRQAGNFVIEPHPDGHHLSLSAETDSLPCETTVHLSEVRPLARAPLDAAADLAGLVIGGKDYEPL
jgi:hypothetical protein